MRLRVIPPRTLCARSYRIKARQDANLASNVPLPAGRDAAVVVRGLRCVASPGARQWLRATAAYDDTAPSGTLALAVFMTRAPHHPQEPTNSRFVPLQACVARITVPHIRSASAASPSTATAQAADDIQFLQLQPPQGTQNQAVQAQWTDFAAIPVSEVSMRTKTLHLSLIPLAASTSLGNTPDHSAMRLAAAVGMLPTSQICWHLTGVAPTAAAELQLQHTAQHFSGGAVVDDDAAASSPVASALQQGALFAPQQDDKLSVASAPSSKASSAVTPAAALAEVARGMQRVVAPKAARLEHWVRSCVTLATAVLHESGTDPPRWSCLGVCPVPIGSGCTRLDTTRTLSTASHLQQLSAAAGGGDSEEAPVLLPLNAAPRMLLCDEQLASSDAWGSLLPSASHHQSRGPAAIAAAAPATDADTPSSYVSITYSVDVHCLSTRNVAVTAHQLDPLLSAGMSLPRPSALHRTSALPHAMRSSKGHWAAQTHVRQRVVWHFWGAHGSQRQSDTRHSLHCAICGVHTGSAQGLQAHCQCAHDHLHTAVFDAAWHADGEPLAAGVGNVGSSVPTRQLHVHISPAVENLTVAPASAEAGGSVSLDDAGAWVVSQASRGRKRQRGSEAAGSSSATSSARKRARRLNTSDAPSSGACSESHSPHVFQVPQIVFPQCVLPPTKAEVRAAVGGGDTPPATTAGAQLMIDNAPIVTPHDAAETGDLAGVSTPTADEDDGDALPAGVLDLAGAAITRQFAYAARRDVMTAEQIAARHRRAAASAIWGLRGVAPLPDVTPENSTSHLHALNGKDAHAKAAHGTQHTPGAFLKWYRLAAQQGVSAALPEGVSEAVAAVQAAVSAGCPPALASKTSKASRRSRAARGGGSDVGPFGAALGTRQYFHSRTGQPVRQWEEDEDSDEEVDSSWMVKVSAGVTLRCLAVLRTFGSVNVTWAYFDLQVSERQLDDFEDVSVEEKELMKLWNRHVHDYGVVTGERVLGLCCVLTGASFVPAAQIVWCREQSCRLHVCTAHCCCCEACDIHFCFI